MPQQVVRDDLPFGKFRSFIWPIHSYELKKVMPMFALFFLITFAYNILRCMKTSLIVTAPGSGAEVIPFLKIGAVLPAALFMTYLFTRLVNRFHREQVIYAMLSLFLSYFALFLCFLYPRHEWLQLDSLADFLQSHVFTQGGYKGLIAIIRHWNLALFYVLSEMWSTVVLSMLFWGFANEVTSVNEAKRFYAIFALGANCSGMFSGGFAHWIQKLPYYEYLPFGMQDQWVFFQLCSVLFVGMLIIALFCWLSRTVLHIENVSTLQIPKKSYKLSLSECFAYLRKSRYLAFIVIIVVSYNIVFNLADVMWTYKLKQIYTYSGDVNTYMNQITMVTGLVAVVFAFVVSGNVLRHYGWTIAAGMTPLIWFLTSIGFFSGLVFEDALTGVFGTLISNPANFVLLLGSIQVCFGRACKYTVFDETKEIAFIPLPEENKRKGKAIVDGVASRFGKSGGSLIYLCLFMTLGDIAYTIPYVSCIILLMIVFWIIAVVGLGKMVGSTVDEEAMDTLIEDFSDHGELGTSVPAETQAARA